MLVPVEGVVRRRILMIFFVAVAAALVTTGPAAAAGIFGSSGFGVGESSEAGGEAA
jgi:hypothetical protein